MNSGTGRLAVRRAVVTGAASGIGRATALRFAAEGAAVLATDLASIEGLGEGIATLRPRLTPRYPATPHTPPRKARCGC